MNQDQGKQKEYPLVLQLRRVADDIERRALRSKSDMERARNMASLVRAVAVRVPELKGAGYFITMNFDGLNFADATTNPGQIDIVVGYGLDKTELFSTASAKKSEDLSSLFDAAATRMLAGRATRF